MGTSCLPEMTLLGRSPDAADDNWVVGDKRLDRASFGSRMSSRVLVLHIVLGVASPQNGLKAQITENIYENYRPEQLL